MIIQLVRKIEPGLAGTEGKLHLPGLDLFTLELPWRDNQKKVSCVPLGDYQLYPHTRPNGDKVYQLVNPVLRVYATEEEIPADTIGRSEILIHAANYLHSLLGCIAVGLTRAIDPSGDPIVLNSQAAMSALRDRLDNTEHTLQILEQADG